MVDFKLDDKGDIVIEDNEIVTVSDQEVTCQKIRQLLKTNLGEWWLNEKEGINFQEILQKNPNFQQIKDHVRSVLAQVDSTLELTDFSHSLDSNRVLHINFTAKNIDETQVDVSFNL